MQQNRGKMSDLAILLRKLDELQTQNARDSLTRPRDNSLFEYGRVVGIQAGLTMAKNAVSTLHEEEKAGPKSFKQ